MPAGQALGSLTHTLSPSSSDLGRRTDNTPTHTLLLSIHLLSFVFFFLPFPVIAVLCLLMTLSLVKHGLRDLGGALCYITVSLVLGMGVGRESEWMWPYVVAYCLAYTTHTAIKITVFTVLHCLPSSVRHPVPRCLMVTQH